MPQLNVNREEMHVLYFAVASLASMAPHSLRPDTKECLGNLRIMLADMIVEEAMKAKEPDDDTT